jgi:hypothetical protein
MKNNYKNILLVLIAILSGLSYKIYGQCSANINATPASGTTEKTISFEAVAYATATAYTFDGGTLPPGWTASPYNITSSICGTAYNSPDDSPYFWATTTEGGVRYVKTTSINVTYGGKITFKMRYGGESAPCEQADLPSEGVFLQYSTDGGSSWNDIATWVPDPSGHPELYVWNEYEYISRLKH